MKTLQGQLLVASPHLRNSVFARSVILLLGHEERGAWGVVLNRPLPAAAAQLGGRLGGRLGRQGTLPAGHFQFGGPVAGTLVALCPFAQHAPPQPPVADGEPTPNDADHDLGILARADNLADMLAGVQSGDVRFYVGFAQWSQGQLEEEIRQGVWLTVPATREHVFGDDDQLWANTLRQLGREILQSALHLTHVPADPTNN